MKSSRIIFLTNVFLLFAVLTNAQIQKHASWVVSVKPGTQMRVGEKVDLIFDVTIDSGWYLYSSDFSEDLGPIPSSVEFEKSPDFQAVGKLIPAVKPKKKFDDIWKAEVTYFTGTARFKQTVKILSKDPVIKGSAIFQTCTIANGLCVPGNEDFEMRLTTLPDAPKPVEAKAAEKDTVRPVAVTTIDSSSLVVVNSDTTRPVISAGVEKPAGTQQTLPPSESLLGFAVTAFLAGLAALLTPCVFPVIPMTVTYFTKQKDGKWKALLYGSFIVLIYTVIGVVVSRINGPAFANFLSTHWFPNIVFFVVFLLFALSFLGMFELVLPTSFVNKMDAKADKGGLFGIFFMAFTLVLISFSCTAPIASSILVSSAGGAVLKPIVGMLAYSSAFAIPFTLFAWFPSWLQSLPKSGGWLNSVKVILGFLELALALKFLSIADQVYHWRILDREVFLALWIVIFAFIAFYLLGKIRTPHDSKTETVSVPRIILSIITFAFVLYMLPGMWGAPLKALAGYLPPQTTHDFDLSAVRPAAPGAGFSRDEVKHGDLFKLPHGLNGYFDFGQAAAKSKQTGKPIFIDFTGHGCVNCREMEARVWSDPAVLRRLQNDYIVVALYVDDKTELPESEWYASTYDNKVKKTIGAQNTDFQIVKYNSNAQPHYCLVDAEGNLLVPPVNYDLSVDHFVRFLDSGKEAFSK